MKRWIPFLYWLLGAGLIVFVLWQYILQYPGYIFFFDASGSFDTRRPFDQYLFTYTPYDGTEVGIKNRLPVMSILAGLYYLARPLFDLTNQDLIKVGYVVLMLGAYTSFYFLLPRFYRYFKGYKLLPANSKPAFFAPLARTLLALLYVTIPFFSYRLTMVHLFYLTTFYPLIVYVYIQLLAAKRVSWRNILFLAILSFFGFTYTNILTYYLLTFLAIGIPYLYSAIRKKEFSVLARNIVYAAVVVVLVNAYWIIPYFLKGAPNPSYVVTDDMVTTLSMQSSFRNVLTDASEWFSGQSQLLSLFAQANQYLLLAQMVGIILLYVYNGLFIGGTKHKGVVVGIVVLLLLVLLAISAESPLFQLLYSQVVYGPLGWLIREPNRARFIFAFWTFLFFSIVLIRDLNMTDTGRKYGVTLPFLVVILFYGAYSLPVFINFLGFLRPTIIPQEVKDVNIALQADSAYSYVQHYPFLGNYKLGWVPEKFYLADSLNYRFFPYLLSRPATRSASTVPTARTKESVVAEMALNKSIANVPALFRYFGINYLLIDKTVKPLVSGDEYSGESQEILTSRFVQSEEFESVVDNSKLKLLRLKDSGSPVMLTNKSVITAEPISVLDKLDLEEFQHTNLLFRYYDTEPIQSSTMLMVQKGNQHYFLDFLDEKVRKKSETFPFDYTYGYGYSKGWKRASPQDRGGAEFSNILRYYGIPVFQYLSEDKVAYSTGISADSLKYTVKASCLGVCKAYAKVMYSTKGGKLEIRLNGILTTISTKSAEKLGFYWVPLENVEMSDRNIQVELINWNGFSAVGGILVLSENTVEDTQQLIAQYPLLVLPDNFDTVNSESQKLSCDVLSYYSDSFIPRVSVSGFCATPMDMRLKQFQSEFLYVDKLTGAKKFVTSVPVNENFQGEIWFFSKTDVVLWVMFVATFVVILVMLELVLLRHVR